MALNFDIVCKFHKVFSLEHNTWIGFEEQCGKMKFGIIHKIDYTFQSNTILTEYDKKTITNTKQLLERTVHIADKAQRTKAYNELKEDCCIALINFVGANNFMTELKKKYSKECNAVAKDYFLHKKTKNDLAKDLCKHLNKQYFTIVFETIEGMCEDGSYSFCSKSAS